jgi:hypothetical protein
MSATTTPMYQAWAEYRSDGTTDYVAACEQCEWKRTYTRSLRSAEAQARRHYYQQHAEATA